MQTLSIIDHNKNRVVDISSNVTLKKIINKHLQIKHTYIIFIIENCMFLY